MALVKLFIVQPFTLHLLSVLLFHVMGAAMWEQTMIKNGGFKPKIPPVAVW